MRTIGQILRPAACAGFLMLGVCGCALDSATLTREVQAIVSERAECTATAECEMEVLVRPLKLALRVVNESDEAATQTYLALEHEKERVMLLRVLGVSTCADACKARYIPLLMFAVRFGGSADERRAAAFALSRARGEEAGVRRSSIAAVLGERLAQTEPSSDEESALARALERYLSVVCDYEIVARPEMDVSEGFSPEEATRLRESQPRPKVPPETIRRWWLDTGCEIVASGKLNSPLP